MPITWRRHPHDRWIVMIYSDPYEFQELERATASMTQDPVFRASKRILVDATNCVPPTADYVKRMIALAEQYSEAMAGTDVAVTVADVATFGMARMAELLLETKQLPLRLQAFRSLEAAEAWLSDDARTRQSSPSNNASERSV